MKPHTIGGINRLPYAEKRTIYARLIPLEIVELFQLNPYYVDEDGHDLIKMTCPAGSTTVELELRHKHDFPDPVLYGHMTDTLNGQIHVLLYVINNPTQPRYDVDRLPDGTLTKFGILHRNLEAEMAAMRAGLAPGQIRAGLGLLREATDTFEHFIESIGHDMYFVEPLFYHNAVIFERYGFAYQQGRRKMLQIQEGFQENGILRARLDGSSPFRQPEAHNSIRLRSWAIHDGILNGPLTDITMYKTIGKMAKTRTTPDIPW